MRYCGKCGSPVNGNEQVCSNCGTSINSTVVGTKKGFSKGKLIALLSIVGGLLVLGIIIIAISSPGSGISLPYRWGTGIEEVIGNENVIDSYPSLNNYIVICEDPFHEVDKLTQFNEVRDELEYSFRENKLNSIRYVFKDGYSLTERKAIATSQYGDKYYEYNSHSNAYYAWLTWLIGDTVVEISFDCVKYMDAEYYFSHAKQEVKDFFGWSQPQN